MLTTKDVLAVQKIKVIFNRFSVTTLLSMTAQQYTSV
jgi:hypothetical protein